MYKLVSKIEGSKWSFMDGYQFYKDVVWLGSKDEVSKYKLIDKNGKKIDFNIEECLEEC